ncbi:hypothetical protein O6H91_11G057400 [Diphasiastrum complanatum]|nr:hypothetical protein O6H91_11G057400 [Diphasiastrum complanatum]
MGFLRNLFKKRAKNEEKSSNSIQLPTNSANFMFDPCPNTLPVLPAVSSYYRAAVSIETPPRVGIPHKVGQMHEAESRNQRSASRFVPNCFTDHYYIADSAKEIPRGSQKIAEVSHMQTYPKGTNSALPKPPLFSRAQPGHELPPPSRQGRKSSTSILPAQLNATLSQISSDAINLASRPFDEKLVNTFQDSRPTSPLSRLSPGAESASPCTSIWSPMECSTSCSPQLSPKGRHHHGSSLPSPQRDSGRIALPLPLPPIEVRKIEPSTIPGKPVPMPLPLPYEEALCPGLCCKNREGANLNSDRDLHRYSRTQFSSPITSPRGFSQSCHQHSPNFSPYHSPYRSSCPSPLASPSPVGSPTPMPQCPRKWQRGQELGRGSFGTVYEGWNL